MDIRMLATADAPLLAHVADDLFDKPIQPHLTAEFLADPRHHICVAVEDGRIVSFASAVHYLHPDKPTELWINEVATAPAYRRRGLSQAVLERLLAHARELGCREAWVLTDEDNGPARALYGSVGGEESTGVVMVTFRLDDEAP